MGGGDGMSELSLVAALSPSCPIAKETIPLSVLQAVRALDQELGEETEREALHAVVDSLVEWFLLESTTPRSRDGAWCHTGQVDVCFASIRVLELQTQTRLKKSRPHSVEIRCPSLSYTHAPSLGACRIYYVVGSANT